MRYPEWKDYVEVNKPFEWKWYYSFQEVGDQAAESLSIRYRAGRLRRDTLAGRFALIAPPALIHRTFQDLAQTDFDAALAYEERVRKFHSQLREFYYPLLFSPSLTNHNWREEMPEYSDLSASSL